MTYPELLAIVNQYKIDSDAEWAASIATHRATLEVAAMNESATQSNNLFTGALHFLSMDPPNIELARTQLGGVVFQAQQRGSGVGDASPPVAGIAALAALMTYASETHLAPDVAAGEGTAEVAGTSEGTGDPDVGTGTGTVDVAGEGAPEEGADVAAGEGEVV